MRNLNSFLNSVRHVTGCQIRSNTNWGPNTLFRKGKVFVGTMPSALKYYWPFPKKPHQPYGIQGVTHLLPLKGLVTKDMPIKIKLKKDLIYSWCACGRSNNQPFCDGSHNRFKEKIQPVRYIAEQDAEVFFCLCKQTNNRPFCDGSHKTLTPEQKYRLNPEPDHRLRKKD